MFIIIVSSVWTTPQDIRHTILFFLVIKTVTSVWTILLDGVHVFPCTLVLTIVTPAVDYSTWCQLDPCCFMCVSPLVVLLPLI